MTGKKAAVRATADEQAAVVRDPYAGQGGSYTRDPVTGVRTLIERTQDHGEAPPVPADDKE